MAHSHYWCLALKLLRNQTHHQKEVLDCSKPNNITAKNMATLATHQATQTDIIRKLELQDKKELVSGIPHSILCQMDDIMLLTANQIWENLKNHYCGNKRIIRNKKTSVLNEFDNFKMLSSETIHDAHDRFNLIMVKMNNLGINKTQHEINLKEIQLFIPNFSTICMENFNRMNPRLTHQPLQLLDDHLLLCPQLLKTKHLTMIKTLIILIKLHLFKTNPSSLIRMMKQIINNCVLWLQTQISRDLSQIMFSTKSIFWTNNSGFQPRPYFGQNSQRPSFQNNLNQGFQNQGFQNDPKSGHNHNPNNSFQNQNRGFQNQGYNNQNNGFQNNQNFGFQQNHSHPSQQTQTQAPKRLPVKSQKDESDEEVIICHNCKGINHYARECRAKNKTKIKYSAYYAQRADELKKMENQEKQRALMAIHEPNVEYWPTSDDEADNEPTQSNFCFVAGVDIPSRALNVIEQSHITKIEKSLEANLKTYHDTTLKTLQLKFGESTRRKSKLERDVEIISEDYNHVLEQINQTLIHKRDLELKNHSVISFEIKDVLEMEILQLKQDFQESTDKYKVLNEKPTDSLKQINSLKTENKRLIWNMDSIKVARKLSDDTFTKENTLGTGKIDTNYRPGIGRESSEIEQAKQENMTNCENSQSTLPDLFTSVNEEDSYDETVINCSPDDTAFTLSKKSFKRVVNSETDSTSSLTHRIKHTDGTTRFKNLLNGENSSYEDGSTSVPTSFPTMSSSIVGKTSLGQKYSKKQQTSKKIHSCHQNPTYQVKHF
uniref:CCHC-type domain-containing protein n=1 Tax=Lactuca sativa TaxID=4236 RepID=A0A9R1VUH3_LACSA|nr:hypothetical protein LSAT_V11C400203010 [Lactuca sativa]